MYAYEVNKQGYIINNYLIGGDVPIPESCVTKQLPQPLVFYRPKWDGTKWVEGETAKEKTDRESRQLLESLKPTPIEISDAELEIKLLTMLKDLGVIQ